MIERIARTICANDHGQGFCACVGGDLGCKVGRGSPPDWQNCIATEAQLRLSGSWATAETILGLIQERQR